MFKLNDNIIINKSLIEDSFIYTIDNFYKNPEEIVNFLLKIEPDFHKKDEHPSYNSIYFDDKRHNIKYNGVSEVYKFLSKVCKQNIFSDGDEILTNFSRFKKHSFNNYNNNYWYPHTDVGYTAIIYFNKNDLYSGTNLYKKLNIFEDHINDFPEHYAPWKDKKKFELIHTINPKYNRMVLFNGFKYFHGMNICNDDYFGESYRMNQVLFFEDCN